MNKVILSCCGDEVQVLDAIVDSDGVTAYQERAKRYESWGVLEKHLRIKKMCVVLSRVVLKVVSS